MDDVADQFATLKSQATEVYGYGIVNDRVAYLIKKPRSRWDDMWAETNGDTVLHYQNCWGAAWENRVRPALNNTPAAAAIIVMIDGDGLYVVRKRDISQQGNARSTFTLLL